MTAYRFQRREFLQAAPVVAGGLAFAPGAGAASAVEPPIASAAFPVGRDYPLRATPFWDVTLNDAFWAPKVARTADVTVPFAIRKLGAVPEGPKGGVLEPALYIARSRPDSRSEESRGGK